MSEIDLRQSWDRLSSDYQRDCNLRTDAAHYGVCAPYEDELRLLGNVAGQRILELGCGGGQCSIAFAREGAECVAVDLSAAQVDHARSLAAREGVRVRFEQGEMIAFLEKQPAASYNIAFSAYAFQYVADLSRLFGATRRVLKSGGVFVFSLDHPVNKVTTWKGDTACFDQSYFARGRREWYWPHGKDAAYEPFYSFHRTTADMLNILVDAGFTVERLLEPEPPDADDPWSSEEDRARYALLPATIIWKARAA